MRKKVILMLLAASLLVACDSKTIDSNLDSNTSTVTTLEVNVSNSTKEFDKQKAKDVTNTLRKGSSKRPYHEKKDNEVIGSNYCVIKDSIVYRTIEHYQILIPDDLATPVPEEDLGLYIAQLPYKTEIWATDESTDKTEVLFVGESLLINNFEVFDGFCYFTAADMTAATGFAWQLCKLNLDTKEKEVIEENNGDPSKPQCPNVFYSDTHILFDGYYNSSANTDAEEPTIERQTKVYDIKTKKTEELQLENRYGKSPYMGITVRNGKVYYISKIENTSTIEVLNLSDGTTHSVLTFPPYFSVSNVAALENNDGEWVFFGDPMSNRTLYGYNITKDFSCLIVSEDLFSFGENISEETLKIKTRDYSDWEYVPEI